MKKLLAFFLGGFLGDPVSKSQEATKNWSKRRLAVDALEQLEPLLDRRFNPMYASAIKLEVPAENINKFISMLLRYCNTMQVGEAIKPTDCFLTKTEMTLDKFFTDETNRYISQEELKVFHKEALRLCSLTESGEKSEFGIDEHNFRILSKVFVGIKQVCDAVVKASKMR